MISLALFMALTYSGICNPLQKCKLELEARVGIGHWTWESETTYRTIYNKGFCELFGFLNCRVITESHNKSPKISHVAECKSCPGSCRWIIELTNYVITGFCVGFVVP